MFRILVFVSFLISVAEAQTIYSTDFGIANAVNPTGWTFTGVNMNINTQSGSSGYTGASGGANLSEGNSVNFTNTAGTTSVSTAATGTSTATLIVNTTSYNSVNISFGMRRSSSSYGATVAFEWSTNG